MKTSYFVFSILTLGMAGCSFMPSGPADIGQLSCSTSAWPTDDVESAQTASGVVHSLFQGDDELGGYFIQNNDRGLFIAAGDHQVKPGSRVVVRGNLDEFQGGHQLTEIDAISYCGSRRVSSTALTFPLDHSDALDAYLHQPVRIETPMTVVGHYQLARFGTLDLATESLWVPTQKVAPGDAATTLAAQNQLKRIVLDDGSSVENPAEVPYPTPGLHINNPVRSGDQVSNIQGVLVKMGAQYHIHPTTTPRFAQNNPRPDSTDIARAGDLRVVTFNVLNYFNGDGQGGGFPTPRGAESAAEFERQHARIVSAMAAMDGDIYALMEIENDGFGEHSAVAELTRGLNQAMPDAKFEFVDPGTSELGGDAITQAIIYRADRVSPIGKAAFTTQGPFAWGSRPPLAQTFVVEATDGLINVVANHFKSKGSCPDNSADKNANQQDGQACWNVLRAQTSSALVHWLRQYPTGYTQQSTLLSGDFNAYAQEDPIRALENAGYVNLAGKYAPDGYSYVFRGEKGSLDHVLAHSSLSPAIMNMAYWHINADEPVAFEYPLDGKSEAQQRDWYAPSPYRSSDHDPIVVDIDSALLPR
ncbi:ExeM/NucH family extracellular endonuclease [Aliidiomarina sp. Khilg15.8]